MKIMGKAKVTTIKEVSDKLIVGSLYISTKQGEEWKTVFVNCKMIGKAVEQMKKQRIQNKDKVEVKGFLVADSYQDKAGIEIERLTAVVQDIKLSEE